MECTYQLAILNSGYTTTLNLTQSETEVTVPAAAVEDVPALRLATSDTTALS